ncbi:MAG TPA: type II secretion system protein [Pyrinomonadaceae bacterium]|nr:type II secretion system protein [Pyrinomonadaceae bacterium]
MNSKVTVLNERRRAERGFSALQLLVVIAIIGIISAMATISISKAQQQLRRENAIREFKGYLEKARIDSIRRHATSTTDQATVTITGVNTYQVALDFNYDGTMSSTEVRTVTIPTGNSVQFSMGSITLPMTTRFDWRGRATATQSGGASVTPLFTMVNTMGDTSSTTVLNLTSMGDASVGTAANVTTPTRTTVATNSNVKSETNTNSSY